MQYIRNAGKRVMLTGAFTSFWELKWRARGMYQKRMAACGRDETKTFDTNIDLSLQCNSYISLLPMNVNCEKCPSSLLLTLYLHLLDMRVTPTWSGAHMALKGIISTMKKNVRGYNTLCLCYVIITLYNAHKVHKLWQEELIKGCS